MNNKTDHNGEKVHTKHRERIIGRFIIDGESFNVVNTKHGVYRILERKNMEISDLSKIILSIGTKELKKHFQIAKNHFNKDKAWERQIDYVISIYDVVNEIVLMIGLHPHLKRITIVTVIPRISNVASNDIYASYRVDSESTKNIHINYLVPENIEMKQVVVWLKNERMIKMKINVKREVFCRDDSPKESDLFIVVQRNENQVPYLITCNDSAFSLINLQSGYINYKGETVEELVQDYLDKNENNKANPVTDYYFVKSYDASFTVNRTFGYKKVHALVENEIYASIKSKLKPKNFYLGDDL